MDSIVMMKTALALMLLTALGGVLMAVIRFARNVNPPSWIAMAHGLLAGSGLTLLIYAWFAAGLPPLAVWSLILFLIAAAGGVVLNLAYHLKNVPLPGGIVAVHGVIAAVAFVLLVLASWTR